MRKIIRIFKKACHVCYGMKVIETGGGNTKTCPACKGNGFL